MQNLPAVILLWIHVQMMETDWQAEDYQQNKGGASHDVAEHIAASLLWYQGIKSGVSRN